MRNNIFHFEWTFVSNSIQYSSWLWCAAVDRSTHKTEYWYSSQSALGCHRGKLSYSNHHTEMCAVIRGDMFVSLFWNFPTGPNFLSYCKILPTAHIYPQKFFCPFGPQNYLQILHFFLKNLPNPTYFPKNSGKSYIFSLKNRQNPSYSVNLPPKKFFWPFGQKNFLLPTFFLLKKANLLGQGLTK